MIVPSYADDVFATLSELIDQDPSSFPTKERLSILGIRRLAGGGDADLVFEVRYRADGREIVEPYVVDSWQRYAEDETGVADLPASAMAKIIHEDLRIGIAEDRCAGPFGSSSF